MKRLSILFLAIYILLASFARIEGGNTTPILINEVLYDPQGSDLGYEWIELYNNTDEKITIDGWRIESAGTKFQISTTLSGEIPPKSLFLVCEMNVQSCDLNVSKLGFQNGGGATDGIQIVDKNNSVIDALFYDSPNSNGLINEEGNIVLDSQVAGNASNGSSLGRINYIDTNNSYNDFTIFTSPTPGTGNLETEEKPDEPEKEELDKAGESPLLHIIIFTSFILLMYSVRLNSHHNLNKQTDG